MPLGINQFSNQSQQSNKAGISSALDDVADTSRCHQGQRDTNGLSIKSIFETAILVPKRLFQARASPSQPAHVSGTILPKTPQQFNSSIQYEASNAAIKSSGQIVNDTEKTNPVDQECHNSKTLHHNLKQVKHGIDNQEAIDVDLFKPVSFRSLYCKDQDPEFFDLVSDPGSGSDFDDALSDSDSVISIDTLTPSDGTTCNDKHDNTTEETKRLDGSYIEGKSVTADSLNCQAATITTTNTAASNRDIEDRSMKTINKAEALETKRAEEDKGLDDCARLINLVSPFTPEKPPEKDEDECSIYMFPLANTTPLTPMSIDLGSETIELDLDTPLSCARNKEEEAEHSDPSRRLNGHCSKSMDSTFISHDSAAMRSASGNIIDHSTTDETTPGDDSNVHGVASSSFEVPPPFPSSLEFPPPLSPPKLPPPPSSLAP
eukprot:CAMPEP_0175063708 /NCGR_PEP_ID=MMETSP0052_2-20121109/14915_1 /TAXON_ID=51329 ORGANISM="Polytomella parva, Strain SAG 63-3" /NCGR_SAMPLE_ID=MMETSP0052_2 /ASSEMBLY_ACC=CAM_ASM_000194 /LENGTH=432 /DNA_ID=CAMNT_0016329953 /DNA_START=284 /DNA_END=1578 /DNA_ORIENTATION=-